MQEKISHMDERRSITPTNNSVGYKSTDEENESLIMTKRGREKARGRRGKRPTTSSPISTGRTPHKKRRGQLKESASSAGEHSSSGPESLSDISDSSPDTDYDDYDIPQITFGAIVGSTLKDKIRKKILENKFLEMAELLPDFKSRKSVEDLLIQTDHNHAAKLVRKRPKIDINFGQWCEAFENFTAVYLERAKTRDSMLKLALSLLTYKRNITDLNRKNYDWAAYDRHFRTDRETDKATWSTVKHNLMVMYQPSHDSFRQNRFQGNSTPNSTPYKKGHNTNNNFSKPLLTKDGCSIPNGYCISFHSRNQRCTTPNCQYLHRCPTCQGRHPVFSCPTTSQSYQNKPSNPEKPATHYNKGAQNNNATR